MQDMEKQKFEDKWKDAFQDAEVSPSDSVWTNIELGLGKDEASVMRRKLTFYKMLAAACVMFALCAGAAGLYLLQTKSTLESQLSQIEKQSGASGKSQVGDQKVLDVFSNENASLKPANQIALNSDSKSDPKKDFSNKTLQLKSSQSANSEISSESIAVEAPLSAQKEGENDEQHSDNKSLIAGNSIESDSDNILNTSSWKLPQLVIKPKPVLHYPSKNEESVADPVALMMAKLNQREQEITSDRKKPSKTERTKNSDKLWTSVGFAAGSFNSSSSSGVTRSTSNAALQADQNGTASSANKEAKASGVAYAMGINLGKRISQRWVFQGGVNYLSQSSDYTTQTAVGSADLQNFRPAGISELNETSSGARADSKIVATSPYSVNNNIKYLSLPLQAGFLLVNSKFGVQLNAGIATDLFLQNVRTAEGQSLEKVEEGRGSSSPYRPFNFSGLMGTELSYKFSNHYRVALNPGVRYPFQSIYKSALGVQSSPLTFDIGLRFRYIFQ
jgi:hypothetical protein